MPEITKSSFVIAVPDWKTIHSVSDPGWLFYTCGTCTIMAGECPDALHPSQLGDHSYFAYLQVRDVDSLHDSVRAAGVQICKSLRDEL